MKKWLLNPFEFIAGPLSLLIGVTAICLTSLIASFSQVHFDGVIDIHLGLATPLWFYFAETLIGWLCVSMVLYSTGKIFSSSSIRIVDVFGTMAMARVPYIIISLINFFFPVNNMLASINEQFRELAIDKTHELAIGASEIAVIIMFSLLSIAITVWVIALMWKAYSTSCNLKGPRGGWSFAIGLIVAEIVSKVAIYLINQNFISN